MSDTGVVEARPLTVSPADRGGRLLRNLTALAGGQVVTWAMTLLWTLLVPRALGPDGLGLVVSAMSVSGVVGIVIGLGTRNYLVRTMVVDADASGRLLGTALVLRLVMTPLFALAVVAYAALAHYGHEAEMVLYLVSLATLLTLIAEPMQAGFQALERMNYLAYSDVINKSAQSVLGIAVVAVGLGATGVGASMACVAVTVVMLNAMWIHRFIPVDLRTTWLRVAQMARESVAYWAYTVCAMLYLWIDTMMLSLMTRPEVVGWYGAPVRLFQTLMFLPVMLSTAWIPRLVSAFRDGGESELRRAAVRPVELVLLLSAPMAAGTAMIAPAVVPMLYGDAFRHAAPVLAILGVCLPPTYGNIMLSSVLMAGGRQRVWTWVMVVATVVNPLFNLFAIPLTERVYGNGAIGAALSLLATELLLTVIGFVIVGREIFDRGAVRRCLLTAMASGAMWAVTALVRPVAGTAPAIGIGIATFLVLILILGVVSGEELESLRVRARELVSQRLAKTD